MKHKVPAFVGSSQASLGGLDGACATSQGSVCELAHGAQGLDALEKWGGSIQELPITGVLDWTAVKSDLDVCFLFGVW